MKTVFDLLKTIIRHCEDGDREAARVLFAQIKLPEVVSQDLRIFLGQIDDYLNDPAVEITGAVTLIDLKRSYIELFGSDGNNS